MENCLWNIGGKGSIAAIIYEEKPSEKKKSNSTHRFIYTDA